MIYTDIDFDLPKLPTEEEMALLLAERRELRRKQTPKERCEFYYNDCRCWIEDDESKSFAAMIIANELLQEWIMFEPANEEQIKLKGERIKYYDDVVICAAQTTKTIREAKARVVSDGMFYRELKTDELFAMLKAIELQRNDMGNLSESRWNEKHYLAALLHIRTEIRRRADFLMERMIKF